MFLNLNTLAFILFISVKDLYSRSLFPALRFLSLRSYTRATLLLKALFLQSLISFRASLLSRATLFKGLLGSSFALRFLRVTFALRFLRVPRYASLFKGYSLRLIGLLALRLSFYVSLVLVDDGNYILIIMSDRTSSLKW